MNASTSSKVFIPNNLKKTIQNLKEIVKNHSDEEIHAMLKDCNMDPNETVQRLLLQDPFHEVKRKRDKRKENIRELVDGRLRPTSQWRSSRGGKGNYSSRNISRDVVTVNNIKSQNRVQKTMEKGIGTSSPPPSQGAEIKLNIPSSSVAGMLNGPAKINYPVRRPQATSKIYNVKTIPSNVENLYNVTKKTAEASAVDPQISPTQKASSNANSVLETSVNTHIPGNVRTIKRKTGKQHVPNKTVSSKASEKTQGESQVDGNPTSDSSQATRPLSRASSGSRPSSNYGNRAQQLNGPQKAVGPHKEWKPKSTIVKPTSVSEKVEKIAVEPKTLEASFSSSSDEPSSKLQTRLEALQVSDTRHVIIPNHLQVSESERTGLSFGSFDSNFGLITNIVNKLESLENSTEFSEPIRDIVESIEEPTSSPQIASGSDQEVELTDHSSASAEIQETIESTEPEIPKVQTSPEYDHQSKTEAAADQSQYTAAQAAPTYSNFGLVPQIIGNQFANVESVEQAAVQDATRTSAFQVQQQFDPATSYYTSMYRPAVAEGDFRFSPSFAPAAAASKYIPVQTGPPQQEGGVSSSGSSPAVTQAPGMIPNPLAAGQQSVPLYRQPPGVHLSHYPTNYLPYNQYLPPQFYLPPPPMHTFLSNTAFSQQPQAGNLYPGLGPTGASPMKYVSQYKPASNIANPAQFVMPTGNEDHSSRYKDSNIYAPGQQQGGEASAWIPIPGRDVTQSTQFYNLPPSQGQPMPFPGIYHHATQGAAPGTIHSMLQPSQTMSGPVEMVGQASAVYQQSQRTQINWANNY